MRIYVDFDLLEAWKKCLYFTGRSASRIKINVSETTFTLFLASFHSFCLFSVLLLDPECFSLADISSKQVLWELLLEAWHGQKKTLQQIHRITRFWIGYFVVNNIRKRSLPKKKKKASCYWQMWIYGNIHRMIQRNIQAFNESGDAGELGPSYKLVLQSAIDKDFF